MKQSTMLLIALVVVIIVVGAGYYYVSSSPNGTTSTTTTTPGASVDGVQILSDNVTKSIGTGTWQIAIKNTGNLTVSSITAFEYLLGKVIAYTIVAWAEWICGMLVLFFVFGLSLTGDPTPLLVTTFFYLLCTTCFGTMLGAAIPNQAAAIQATQLGGFLTSF